MKVEVPSKLEDWVSAQIEAGAFRSTDELLTEALELLKMRLALEEQSAFLSRDAKRRAALRELVEQGQQFRMGY